MESRLAGRLVTKNVMRESAYPQDLHNPDKRKPAPRKARGEVTFFGTLEDEGMSVEP